MSLFKRFSNSILERRSDVPLRKYVDTQTKLNQYRSDMRDTFNMLIIGGFALITYRQDQQIEQNKEDIAKLQSKN